MPLTIHYVSVFNQEDTLIPQSDLIKDKERNGIADFMQVLRIMSSVDVVEFGIDDIVRSGLVKEYLLAKLEMGI